MATRSIKYIIRVDTGAGQRATVGRFNTKAEAKKRLSQIKRNQRTSADTRNPRISVIMGFN